MSVDILGVATGFLALTAAVIVLFVFGVEVDNIYWLHLLFIMLMVIYAAVSAVV
jgi:hypothetical protein